MSDLDYSLIKRLQGELGQLRQDEIIGRCFHEVFGPEVAARFDEAADRAIATRRTVRYLGSTRLDTFLRDIEVTVAPHFAGDSVQLITSIRDIRDRMALEREREATDRRVRTLWLTPAGWAAMNRILEINHSVREEACAGLAPGPREALIQALGEIKANLTLNEEAAAAGDLAARLAATRAAE